jgi:hypothetical protein
MVRETQEKRFGRVAVEKGFVTPEQILEAMRAQILEEVEQGKHRRIGAILMDQRAMTKKQIDEVLDAM